MTSGANGATFQWPGATSVAESIVWKYSVRPSLRRRWEQ
jgi:hypothetical protein